MPPRSRPAAGAAAVRRRTPAAGAYRRSREMTSPIARLFCMT
jgi:hypothetical protein